MEDEKIIELYWMRSEDAIRETDAAHGAKLLGLSCRIVQNREDAQECVNDTYLKAWETIPPQRPNYFFGYLAKICRFLSFGRLDWNNADKRSADVVQLTAEMELCIPDSRHTWRPDEQLIGEILNRFLDSLPRQSRLVFLRRYWYADSIAEIARRYQMSQSSVKTRLHRTRSKLRTFLEQEGIAV